MKLITLGVAALLAVGSVGMANATLVQNGDFSQTSPTPSNPTQIGWSGAPGTNGQFVTNWQGDGYTIWYPSANAAVSGCGVTQYHSGSGGDCSTLNAVGTPVPGSGSFVAMDGVQNSLQGSIWQTISGLNQGDNYSLTFYWGTTQEAQASSKTKSHDEYLTVSLGSDSQSLGPESADWGDFHGWWNPTLTFTATGTSEVLKFLASGLPSDGPPMILLTGVSMTHAVPEPPELAMFGGGLLALGLLTMFARRRALRRNGAGGDDDMA